MSAELIVVNGPHAGTRFSMGETEILVGRATNAHVVLPDPEVSWRHCTIRKQGKRYLLSDLKSAIGTHVNGMRSAERWLEDRDQIGIGKMILMFRSGEGGAEVPVAQAVADTKPVLLAACSLVFLFRALAATIGQGPNKLLQGQILRLVGDLIPTRESVLLLGATRDELERRYEDCSKDYESDFKPAIGSVCVEGAFSDSEDAMVGVPLYLEGVLGGSLIIRVQEAEASRLTAHLETLTAVASLASIGFEANHEVETLKAENALLQEQIGVNSGIVGNSPLVRRLLDKVERVAPRDTTVLITGESGTGKELIARALHQKSERHERPFIAVNCAALGEHLFESELFGHEKGAFTGAIATKKGRFELAQGGTIFLDEVGELALGLQAKLLRVLQEREFDRVGGTQSHTLDVRVIAATNKDLGKDVLEKKFREDLFHRLNVVNLESPPLRERHEDIPALAEHFLRRSVAKCKRAVAGVSREAMEIILAYDWPGNVRELENAIEGAVATGVADYLLPEDLPERLLEAAPRDSGAKYHNSVGRAKCDAILDAYEQGGFDYKQAAILLGLHPNYLLRLVRTMGLRDEINKRQKNNNNDNSSAAGR